MDKRGSHVGMVLSFVIFVTFLLFIFSVLQPEIQDDKTNKAAMENLEEEILENISSKMTSFTLSISQDKIEEYNCIQINNLIPLEDKVIVKNSSNKIVGASNSGENLQLETKTEKGFFKVYYSQLFEEENIACSSPVTISSLNYSISSVSNKKHVFSQMARELNRLLKTDYSSIKDSFRVPPNKEFQFALVLDNGTEIGNLNLSQNLKTNVEFKEWPVQYIGNKANIMPGDLKIRVW